MNCGYCGKAHTSGNDRCRGCGVQKSSETVSVREPVQRQLRARVAHQKRLKRAFIDIPIINFVIGITSAALPIFVYFALMYVQTMYEGDEIISGFTMLVGAVVVVMLFANLISDT